MSRAILVSIMMLLVHILLGGLCLAASRGVRRSRGLQLWGTGLNVYALGILITVAVGVMPNDIRRVSGNWVICIGSAISAAALLSYLNRKWSRMSLILGLSACLAALIVNHVFGIGLVVDVIIPTLYASILFVIATWLLSTNPPADAVRPSRFLVVALVLTVLFWNSRLVAIWMAVGGGWDQQKTDLATAITAIGQTLAVIATTVGLFWIEARQMAIELERFALTDVLTGLPNTRSLRLQFSSEVARAKRAGRPFGVALFDLDHFKEINDTHGHQAGDAVLAGLAGRFEATKRGTDVVGRIGGEEFLVILPELEREKAIAAAERLRVAAGNETIAHDGKPLRVTVSSGLAIFPDDGDDWERLYAAADRRLYSAKNTGRNRLVADDS